MKIGIITFHWAANHGAIIQAFALQKYLQQTSPHCDIQIIDYYPPRYKKTIKGIFRTMHPGAIIKNYKEYRKDRLLQDFRNNLKRTRYFSSEKELSECASDFDVVICGSDQIWNEFFTLHGERGVTTAYFLSFCPNSKKIAYAASFGFVEMKEEMKKIVKPLLEKFSAISVRENSGKRILNDLGIPCEKVCDPTFLVDKTLYQNLAKWDGDHNIVAKYILRKQTNVTLSLINALIARNQNSTVVNLETLSMEKWLGAISKAKCCITNSFHCSVFSILFHTPFYIIKETQTRSGMNDRLSTLLDALGLSERIVESCDTIDNIVAKDIDWNQVDMKLNVWIKKSKDFILKNCFEKDITC